MNKNMIDNRVRWVAAGALAGLLVVAPLSAQQTGPTGTPAAQPAQGARRITFEEAIRIGLENNPTLKIAENTNALDAISVRQQQMQFLPNLSVTSGTSESIGRSFSQDEGKIVTQSTNALNAGLSSSVVVFNGFSNVASLQQARVNEAASEQDVTRARQTVVFNVMSNYLTLVQQQEQLRVQQEALAAQEQQEAQIQAYVNAGAKAISDLYQQQATTASSRLAVVQAQRSVQVAQLALIRTLHLDPLQDYAFEVPALGDTTTSYTTADLTRLTEQALSQRADLAAAQARVKSAEQGLRIASATRWPSISVSAGYNSSYSSANSLGVFDQLNQKRGGSLGLNISLPVFDRLNSRLAKDRANIQMENAQLTVENTQQTVAIDVKTAVLDLQSAQEQLKQAEAQMKAADLALQTSQQRYNVGAATLVELSQARATQVRAASDLVNARYGLVFQSRVMDYYLGNLSTNNPAAP